MSTIRIEEEHGSEVRVPGWALASMAALMVLAMVLAGTARLTGMGTVSTPQVLTADARASVDIVFQPLEDGALRIVDGSTGRELRVLAAGEGGFMRGVLRPLERERMRLEADADAPYRVLRAGDGTLALVDPSTGVTVDLAAFGRTSAEAFAGLLETATETQASR